MKDSSSFDRVAAALDHKEPDRVPLDFGGAEVASINIRAITFLYPRFLAPLACSNAAT
jgi:hypothetical protein